MSDKLPKAKRVGARNTRLAVVLAGLIVVLVGVVVYLILGSPIFTSEPTTDAERDYQLLLEGLKKDPKNPAVLMTIAETEYLMGRKGQAMDHAEQAMKYGKDQKGLQIRYAQLLVQEKEYDKALKALKVEVELTDKASAEPYFLIAQVYAEKKDYKSALKNMKIGLGIAPQAADMRAVYADILVRSGKKKEGIEEYKEALKFLPNDPGIVAALKKLGVEVKETTSTVNPHGDDEMPFNPAEDLE